MEIMRIFIMAFVMMIPSVILLLNVKKIKIRGGWLFAPTLCLLYVIPLVQVSYELDSFLVSHNAQKAELYSINLFINDYTYYGEEWSVYSAEWNNYWENNYNEYDTSTFENFNSSYSLSIDPERLSFPYQGNSFIEYFETNYTASSYSSNEITVSLFDYYYNIYIYEIPSDYYPNNLGTEIQEHINGLEIEMQAYQAYNNQYKNNLMEYIPLIIAPTASIAMSIAASIIFFFGKRKDEKQDHFITENLTTVTKNEGVQNSTEDDIQDITPVVPQRPTWDEISETEKNQFINDEIKNLYQSQLSNEKEKNKLTREERALKRDSLEENIFDLADLTEDEKKVVLEKAQEAYDNYETPDISDNLKSPDDKTIQKYTNLEKSSCGIESKGGFFKSLILLLTGAACGKVNSGYYADAYVSFKKRQGQISFTSTSSQFTFDVNDVSKCTIQSAGTSTVYVILFKDGKKSFVVPYFRENPRANIIQQQDLNNKVANTLRDNIMSALGEVIN